MVLRPAESDACTGMPAVHNHTLWPDAVPVLMSWYKPGETTRCPEYPHMQHTSTDHHVEQFIDTVPHYIDYMAISAPQSHGLRDTPWAEQARPRRACSTAMRRGIPCRSASPARLFWFSMWPRVRQRPAGRLECPAGTSPGQLGLRWLLVSLLWQCFLHSVLDRGR